MVVTVIKGITAVGTGGALLAANNLSDLANVGSARDNLGLGTIATQNANNVNIIGGSISGISISVSGGISTTGTVSAAALNVTGDVLAQTGKVLASAAAFVNAVSAGSLHVDNIVSANALTVTTAISAASLHIQNVVSAGSLNVIGAISAASLSVTGNIDAAAGQITASGATFTAAVTANSLHVNTVISAAGDINTATNFIAGARAAVVSGDSGNFTGAAISGTTGTFSGAVSALSLHINNAVSAGTVNVTTTISAANAYFTSLSVASVSGFVVSKQIYVETPSNKTYPIDTIAAFPYTINTVNGIKTSAGTITAAVKINGSAVTGLSAIAVDASANVTATGANTVLTGDVVSLVLTSNSAADSLQFTLKATRNG